MGNALRNKTIEKLAAKLSAPRLQISAILAITASSAFLASVIMLRLDVTDMSIRYPLAVIVGYVVFLILLRIWIWLESDERSNDINIDLPDSISLSNIGSGSSTSDAFKMGGGGDFAGAGAGGDWVESDVPRPMPAFVASPQPAAPVTVSSSSNSGSSGMSFDLGDIDDGVALLVVLVVLVLVFSALIYVVWVAPILFAELIIDAAVVGGLYRPIKNIERRHWLLTALKKTGIPALIILILMFIAGVVMQSAVPEAITIGQFFEAVL